MELKIFDRDLNLIGILDSFSSLIWNRKYNSVGDFQLNILFTQELNELLKIDNIIYKDNGEGGYIVSKEIKVEDDGTESIEVKGKFILGYLERRIILGSEDLNSNIIDAVYTLINNNCIECSIERIIPNLILGEKLDTDISLSKQISYGNLLDAVKEILQPHEIGLKIDFNIKKKKLILKLYKGINRSINQKVIAPVIFSRSFENVLSQNYLESISSYKNVALVAGAGEGEKRKTLLIGEASGLDRHEIYIDARDIQDTKTIEKNGESIEQEIPQQEYMNLLETRGKEKLAEYYDSKTFDSIINSNSNLIYKQDYDLGDVVTFFDKKWGITMDTRITEISETYNEQGMNINITFGNDVPTLIDIIKRK